MQVVFLWWFLAPVFIVIVFARFWQKPSLGQTEQQALCVPFYKVFPQNTKGAIRQTSFWLSALFWLGCLLFTLACLRPVSYGKGIPISTKARQMMIVLDVSGSMENPDFFLNHHQMTRLDAVKQVARDFLQKRKGDAIGLVIFGSQAFAYVPLTLDIQTAEEMLSETGVGIAGTNTAIGDALALALKQLEKVDSESKVIVLLSDGFVNAGLIHPEQALETAQKMNVKIYTIGLGAEEQSFGGFFFSPLLRSSAELDEALLQQIAQQTKGAYFRVKTTDELKQVYETIEKLEPIENQKIIIRPQKELFWYPLLGSLICFFALFILSRRVV